MRAINWATTLQRWEPSKDFVEKLGQQGISEAITFLKEIFDSGDVMIRPSQRSTFQALQDRTSTWSLIELAFMQLAEHGCAWKVIPFPGTESFEWGLEMPIAVPDTEELRYLKFIRGRERTKKGTRILQISYHKSECQAEIRYND